MSNARYSIIPSIAVYDQQIHGTPIMVLLVLGTKTDRHGWCMANQSRIGEIVGVGRSAVNRAIKLLDQLGYIKKYDTRRKGQPGGICKYQVIMDRGIIDDGQPVEDIPVGQNNGPASSSNMAGQGLCRAEHKGGGCALNDTTVVSPSEHKGVVSPRRYNTTTPINNVLTDEKGAGARSSFFQGENLVEEGEEQTGATLPSQPDDIAQPGGERVCKKEKESPPPEPQHDLGAELQTKLNALAEAVGSQRLGRGCIETNTLRGWLLAGADFEDEILPAVARQAKRKRSGPINSWRYFSGAVADAMALRKAGLPLASEKIQNRIQKAQDGQKGGGGGDVPDLDVIATSAARYAAQMAEIDMNQPFGRSK